MGTWDASHASGLSNQMVKFTEAEIFKEIDGASFAELSFGQVDLKLWM